MTQAGSSVPAHNSVAALFEDAFTDPQSLIRPTAVPSVFLVPGSRAMQRHDAPCPELAGHRQLVLRDFVREAGPGFDVVLIDCPPNIYLSAWCALCDSEAVIVPVQPEDYGAQGIAVIREVITAVQAGPNAALRLLVYLITMRNRRLGIHTVYERTLREWCGPKPPTGAGADPAGEDHRPRVLTRWRSGELARAMGLRPWMPRRWVNGASSPR
jgi:chromosome partitioning protein